MNIFWKKSLATVTALMLAVTMLASCTPGAAKTTSPAASQEAGTAIKAVEAAYPAPIAESMDAQAFVNSKERWDWINSYIEKTALSQKYQADMGGCYQVLMQELLVSEDENTVCSPLNIYIALAMLAEVSGGNTRQQILDTLQVSDIESLRVWVAALWNSNYVNTPILKSLLADSIWLNDSVNYKADTLERLAKEYYASAFRGTPGSQEMDQALQQWTDKNTGGLLSDYTKNLKLDPETALALVSTIYYKAAWLQEFYADSNTQETFHGVKGDTTVEMMHQSDTMEIFRGEDFTAIRLILKDSGFVYFYLSKEGADLNKVLKEKELLALLQSDASKWSSLWVNLSLPKFKVSRQTDLMATLSALGITDAMDAAKADFSPLTEEKTSLALTKAEHAAVVEIDENGVTGAAYTELAVTEGAMEIKETMDFTLDRPFIFIVTGQDGSILFSGVVRNIE